MDFHFHQMLTPFCGFLWLFLERCHDMTKSQSECRPQERDPAKRQAGHQGPSGTLDAPARMAAEIVGILARQQATSATMRESLVVALEKASSFAAAKAVSSLIESLVGFTDTHLQRIEAAINANSQVSDSFGVPARLQRIINRNRPASKKSERPPERTKW